MEISARNTFRGTIKEIKPGAVNTEVVVELSPDYSITSIITKESAERLKLEPGKQVFAVVKASDVMIGTD